MDAVNLKKPKNVPIVSNMITFPIAYAKEKTLDLIKDPDKFAEKWTDIYKDVYFDGAFVNGLTTALQAIEIMGSGTFFVSRDGVTLQHKENTVMRDDEYDELIKNPREFMINTLAPRKFGNLTGDESADYETLKKAISAFKFFFETNMKTAKTVKEKYGIVTLATSKVYAPFDVIFDRLRGFSGSLVDCRRMIDKVSAAAEALYPLYYPLCKGNAPFPLAISTVHAPTYLGPEVFGKVFWPTFKRMILDVHSRGSQTVIVMEGDWSHLYEFLDELPDKSVVMNREKDDPFVLKKKLGRIGPIAAAVPTTMMRYKSKQECIDFAKKLIDECAYDGGLIFMSEISLITGSDINIDNLIAVNQFVHEYGKF
jgi:hypothetical protein